MWRVNVGASSYIEMCVGVDYYYGHVGQHRTPLHYHVLSTLPIKHLLSLPSYQTALHTRLLYCRDDIHVSFRAMVAFNDIFTFPLLALSAAAGLLDPLKPDSKVARNVLEGKAEGYCTVS